MFLRSLEEFIRSKPKAQGDMNGNVNTASLRPKMPEILDTEDVTSDLTDLWRSKDLFDVVFLCPNGEHIEAHKLILSMRSLVFRAMFQSTMEKAKTQVEVVQIEDLEWNTLNTLLKYLYTGHAQFSTKEEIMDIIRAADQYQVDKLKHSAIRVFVEVMDLKNVGDLVVIVHTCGATNKVKLKVQGFLHKHRVELMKSAEFQDLTEQYPVAFSSITYGNFTRD